MTVTRTRCVCSEMLSASIRMRRFCTTTSQGDFICSSSFICFHLVFLCLWQRGVQHEQPLCLGLQFISCCLSVSLLSTTYVFYVRVASLNVIRHTACIASELSQRKRQDCCWATCRCMKEIALSGYCLILFYDSYFLFYFRETPSKERYDVSEGATGLAILC